VQKGSRDKTSRMGRTDGASVQYVDGMTQARLDVPEGSSTTSMHIQSNRLNQQL
jgi:hypothetical protein